MSEATSTPIGVWDPDRRTLTAGLLLSIGLFALEGMGVVPALPTAVRELGGLDLFGWTFTAFMLSWLVGSVAGGWIADGFGPRLPMALGLLGFGAGLLVAAAAPSILPLLLGRALQGLGGGGMISAAYVAISRGYPDTLRARIMALTSSVWILPAVVGPAISGAVTQALGWRYVFAGVVPFIVVVAAIVLPQLRRFDQRAALPGHARLTAAIQAAVGTAAIVAAPSLRARGLAVSGAAATVGIVLLVVGMRGVLPLGVWLARPGLPAGLAARGLLAFGFFGTEAFIPLAATQLRGASPTEAGLALSAGAFGWTAATWAQDRLDTRNGPTGRPTRVLIGFIVLGLGVAGVAAALILPVPLFFTPLAWAVSGAGVGLGFSAAALISIASARRGEEGQVAGQLQVAEAICTSAGAGIGGAILSVMAHAGATPHRAHAAVFAATGTAAVLGLVVARRLGERTE